VPNQQLQLQEQQGKGIAHQNNNFEAKERLRCQRTKRTETEQQLNIRT
jgi:hypothetical protein